jgi:hypothetical protein
MFNFGNRTASTSNLYFSLNTRITGPPGKKLASLKSSGTTEATKTNAENAFTSTSSPTVIFPIVVVPFFEEEEEGEEDFSANSCTTSEAVSLCVHLNRTMKATTGEANPSKAFRRESAEPTKNSFANKIAGTTNALPTKASSPPPLPPPALLELDDDDFERIERPHLFADNVESKKHKARSNALPTKASSPPPFPPPALLELDDDSFERIERPHLFADNVESKKHVARGTLTFLTAPRYAFGENN